MGMKVLCLNHTDTDGHLQEGQVYEVLREDGSNYILAGIIDPNHIRSDCASWSKRRFMQVPEGYQYPNTQGVASIADLRQKWGLTASVLRRMVEELIKRVPKFPGEKVLAGEIGRAMADLESALLFDHHGK